MSNGASGQPDSDQPASTPVVVGVDGSDASHNALAWATDKAGTFGAVTPLTIQSGPGQPKAGPGLVGASAGSDLLVVGTRRRPAAVAAVLGSVSSYCVSHSTVPVAVIPPGCPVDRPLSRMLVGIDDSDNARAALRWAIDHAASNATIDAIAAVPTWGGVGTGYDPPREVLQERLEQILRECAKDVTGASESKTSGGTGAKLRLTPIPEDVTYVMRKLVDERFDVLVLGGRGRSGLHHFFFGSISTALTHHPKVPTVIIPGDRSAPE